YLEGKAPFDNPVQYPLPELLLLDLHLPRVDGFKVLRRIRSHPRLSHMLVVILSSSDKPEEIKRAEELGANSYFVKPQDPAKLVEVVKRLQEYCLGIEAFNNVDEEILPRSVMDSEVVPHLTFGLVHHSAA